MLTLSFVSEKTCINFHIYFASKEVTGAAAVGFETPYFFQSPLLVLLAYRESQVDVIKPPGPLLNV